MGVGIGASVDPDDGTATGPSAMIPVTASPPPLPQPRKAAPTAPPPVPGAVRRALESMSVPSVAFVAALALFGVVIIMTGHNPFAVYYQMYRGSFWTWCL